MYLVAPVWVREHPASKGIMVSPSSLSFRNALDLFGVCFGIGGGLSLLIPRLLFKPRHQRGDQFEQRERERQAHF